MSKIKKGFNYAARVGGVFIAIGTLLCLTKEVIEISSLEQKTQEVIIPIDFDKTNVLPSDATRVDLDTLDYQNSIDYLETQRDSSYIPQ